MFGLYTILFYSGSSLDRLQCSKNIHLLFKPP